MDAPRVVADRSPWPAVCVILAVHVALVPLAIFATLAAFGFENSLTLRNQNTWSPIVSAQLSLLPLVLAFGPGRLPIRLAWFFGGAGLVLVSVVWAYSMLATFPDPALDVWVGHLKLNSVWVLLPTLAKALLLLTVRPLFGLASAGGEPPRYRFGVSDVLATMLVVAVVVSWFRCVLTPETRSLFSNGAWAYAWHVPLQAATALAVWWVATSDRARVWAALALLAAAAVVQWQVGSVRGAFPWPVLWGGKWALVFVTLLALRRWVWRAGALPIETHDADPLPEGELAANPLA